MAEDIVKRISIQQPFLQNEVAHGSAGLSRFFTNHIAPVVADQRVQIRDDSDRIVDITG